MKYIFRLTQEKERIVIVDAENLEEADQKLSNNEIEKEYQRVTSKRVYGDWEYRFNDFEVALSENHVITCADDLAGFYDCEDMAELEKKLLKCKNNGICADWDEEKIMLMGYIEGFYTEHLTETMYFPFTINEFMRVRDMLKGEVRDRLWDKWNEIM